MARQSLLKKSTSPIVVREKFWKKENLTILVRLHLVAPKEAVYMYLLVRVGIPKLQYSEWSYIGWLVEVWLC